MTEALLGPIGGLLHLPQATGARGPRAEGPRPVERQTLAVVAGLGFEVAEMGYGRHRASDSCRLRLRLRAATAARKRFTARPRSPLRVEGAQ